MIAKTTHTKTSNMCIRSTSYEIIRKKCVCQVKILTPKISAGSQLRRSSFVEKQNEGQNR